MVSRTVCCIKYHLNKDRCTCVFSFNITVMSHYLHLVVMLRSIHELLEMRTISASAYSIALQLRKVFNSRISEVGHFVSPYGKHSS